MDGEVGVHPPGVGRAFGLLRRRHVDGALDWLRFRIDTFPRAPGPLRDVCSTGYQPLPVAGLNFGKRAAGTESRWQAIAPVVDEVGAKSALDLGCNIGFFAVSLAAKGIPTIGVEADPTFYRTVLYVRQRWQLDDLGVLALKVDPRTVSLLPRADAVLFLSVWHHLVRAHGLGEATGILEQVWARAARVLFFDTGEREMGDEFGMPEMTPDPQTWLTHHLGAACPGGRVEHLGLHAAFAPDGRPCRRNLFGVLRTETSGLN